MAIPLKQGDGAYPVYLVDVNGNPIPGTGGVPVTIGGPLGRQADALSASVALSTEDVVILNSLLTSAIFQARTPSALDNGGLVLPVSLYGKGSVAGDTALNIITPGDGDAIAAALRVASLGRAYNGATVDTWRNNMEGTALVSAARTATINSGDIINYNGGGIAFFLNVTAASGTGGLQPYIQVKDPTSATYAQWPGALPTAVVSTGLKLYYYGPHAYAGNVVQAVNSKIPRTFRFTIAVGDASSYTYSLGYALLL